MARISPAGSENHSTEELDSLSTDEKALLDRYYTDISMALESYGSAYHIEKWEKVSSIQWRGFCLYVGKNVFCDRSLLREKVRASTSAMITNNNAYNLPLLSGLFDIYRDLCYSVPGLPCRAADFIAFVGIPLNVLTQMGERVTPLGLDLKQKIYAEQESSVALAGESGRINVTMALAWENHFHGWTQAREIIHRDGGAALDSGSWKSRFLGDSGQEKPGISTQVAPLLPESAEK